MIVEVVENSPEERPSEPVAVNSIEELASLNPGVGVVEENSTAHNRMLYCGIEEDVGACMAIPAMRAIFMQRAKEGIYRISPRVYEIEFSRGRVEFNSGLKSVRSTLRGINVPGYELDDNMLKAVGL